MSDDAPLTSHAALNRRLWDQQSADYQSRHGELLARSGGTAWGLWQVPESTLKVLGDVRGLRVLELGCGAARWAIALSREGACVTGLDNSAAQLEHARLLMRDANIDFPLVHASAESTGLAAESFDIVFCDFGAMTFTDPHLSVPEAARVLRPGGLFAFSTFTPLLAVASDPRQRNPTERLVADYWDGIYRYEEPEEPVVFNLPYGEWIRLFRANGMIVEDLIELCPAPDAVSSFRDENDREWARRWPMEHIWRLRKSDA